MAEFYYYLSLEERRSVVTGLASSKQFAVYIDENVESPRPRDVRPDCLEEILAVKKTRQFFIADANDGRTPQMKRISTGPSAGKYYINWNDGPLLIALQLPPNYIKDDVSYYGTGSVYYNLKNRKTISLEDKESAATLYRACVNYLQNGYLKSHVLNQGKRIFVGLSTISNIHRPAKIQVDGKWLSL